VWVVLRLMTNGLKKMTRKTRIEEHTPEELLELLIWHVNQSRKADALDLLKKYLSSKDVEIGQLKTDVETYIKIVADKDEEEEGNRK
jgi:hypothetical protein